MGREVGGDLLKPLGVSRLSGKFLMSFSGYKQEVTVGVHPTS